VLKLLTTLFGGAATQAEDSMVDTNAIQILDPHLLDALHALAPSFREQDGATAHQGLEEQAVAAPSERINKIRRRA
jgi:hypothetical protein